VDNAIDKGEAEYAAAAADATKLLETYGPEVFVFTSDLEYALITNKNKAEVAEVLTNLANSAPDYRKGYDLNALRRVIGSKGIPIGPNNDPRFKIPYVHRKIATTIDLNNCSPDIQRLLKMIDELK
jgi:hypothetical protein